MSDFWVTCPHCLFEAPRQMFGNAGSGMLRCKRCRTQMNDPDAYNPDTTYADCDSICVMERFPFFLNGLNTVIYIRDGYMALVVGDDGSKRWFKDRRNLVTDMLGSFQLYYICLKPQIVWGIAPTESFGAYGTAQLSLRPEYVEAFCSQNDCVTSLEEHLHALLIEHITKHARTVIDMHNAAQLRSVEGYKHALGLLEFGVSVTKIELEGYRDAGFHAVIPSPPVESKNGKMQEDKHRLKKRATVEILKATNDEYVIADEVEEVFIRSRGKTERHKAGEIINAKILRHSSVRVRFFSKEFEFSNGWGVYDQRCCVEGYFSANGTISFYIDRTELLAKLVAKTADWEEFEEEFFKNVLREKIAAGLKYLLDMRLAQNKLEVEQVNDDLSALSVEMTTLFNGENERICNPAFAQYGLRVKSIDIDNIDFYLVRR